MEILMFVIFLCPFVVFGVDQDALHGDSFVPKPTGPYYCQARCVAMCNSKTGENNISVCLEDHCANFETNPPCDQDDTECWKTCGSDHIPDSSPAPNPVQNLTAEFETHDRITDPHTVKLQWDKADDTFLYIVEIFPMKSMFRLEKESVVKLMTTGNFYMFKKPDLCGYYMASIIAVNAFGHSIPEFRRINEWKPFGDTNLQFDITSIEKPQCESCDSVKVFLNYKKENGDTAWQDGDVEISDSSVRAFDCNRMVDSVFETKEPDENGFYRPIVMVTEKDNGEIELNFPAEIMKAECKFFYKVISLKTRCGATTIFTDEDKVNQVDFSISCKNVKNANCDSSEQNSSETFEKKQKEPEPTSDESSQKDNPASLGPLFEKETTTTPEKESEPASEEKDTQTETPSDDGTTLLPAPMFPSEAPAEKEDGPAKGDPETEEGSSDNAQEPDAGSAVKESQEEQTHAPLLPLDAEPTTPVYFWQALKEVMQKGNMDRWVSPDPTTTPESSAPTDSIEDQILVKLSSGENSIFSFSSAQVFSVIIVAALVVTTIVTVSLTCLCTRRQKRNDEHYLVNA